MEEPIVEVDCATLLTRWRSLAQSCKTQLEKAASSPDARRAWTEAVRTASEVVDALTEAAICEVVAWRAMSKAEALEVGEPNDVAREGRG